MKKFWILSLFVLLILARSYDSFALFGSTTYTSGYQGLFNPSYPVSIPSASPSSAPINTGGFALTGVYLPAAFTGTTITFLAAPSATASYVPVKSTTTGTTLSYTVAQGTYAAIDPKDFQGIAFLKIISGSTEAGPRTLTCTLKGF